MRKLRGLDGFGEEGVDSPADKGSAEDVVDGGAFPGVSLEASVDEVCHVARVVGGDGGVYAAHDLEDEAVHVFRVKGVFESEHLVEDDAHGPHV